MDEAGEVRLMRLKEVALSVAIGEAVNAVREEGGDNRGAKVREYLDNAGIPVPAAWCAAFMQWVADGAARFIKNDNPLSAVHREALVEDYVRLAENNGWTVKPHAAYPGDLVAYRFGSSGRWNHIGIVLTKPWAEDDEISFEAVEGNTSPGVGTSTSERERDGDGVYRKRRTYRNGKTCFIAWDEGLRLERAA